MSLAESEFARIMASTGAARMQGLMKLTRTNADFAPGWAALAEEHWASRRREEALQAAKKALRLEPKLHARFSIELRLASRPILAEVAPQKPRLQANAISAPDPIIEAVGARAGQMLDTALALGNRDERLAVLEDLKEFAPNDPALLFHLAKELAVVGRSEDARIVGDELRTVAPERYGDLYNWASTSLAREQAEYEGRSSRASRPAMAPQPAPQPAPVPAPAASHRPDPMPADRPAAWSSSHQGGHPMHPAQLAPRPSHDPREPDMPTRPIPQRQRRGGDPMMHRPSDAHMGNQGPGGHAPVRPAPDHNPGPPPDLAPRPTSTLDQVIGSIDRNLRARGIEQTPGESEFDEAATVDVGLGELGLEDDGQDEDEATVRAKLHDMAPPGQPGGENVTVRLHLSELQQLVTASVDPELDK